MIVYKKIKQFDHETGKRIEDISVFGFYICDFTGDKLLDFENPNTYTVNYNSNDPCAGDGEGERWLYKWNDNGHHHELFLQSDYVFGSLNGEEVFQEMLDVAKEEMEDGIFSLDHLLRWSRGRMLEKVLKEGTYKLEQFLID